MMFRTDIQALRGLAVLLVVIGHADIGLLKAGYLGVDIFFVISGYLITGMVRKQMEAGGFSFTEFYFRRAKRLLPAAYVTFLITALLAPLFLAAPEMKDFIAQLIGAVTFTANVVLWRQSGYFAGEAEFKPLLHVWSLSIEEQYYLLLPASMALVPRRYWRLGAVAIVIGSGLLCLVLVQIHPGATFYLLPTRAWELGIGSVAALGAFDGPKLKALVARLFWPSLLALAALPIAPTSLPHPGVDAVLVCVATLVVILCRHRLTTCTAPARALAFVGDFSYSLYLVHWPIFAFLNNAYVGGPTLTANLIAVALALSLSYLLYRAVELPVRQMSLEPSRALAAVACGASLAVVAVPFAAKAVTPPDRDFSQARRVNHGFGKECEFAGNFTPKPECRNSESPSVMVWGDSFAMHLVPGLAAVTERGIVQATKSMCGPFAQLAPGDSLRYLQPWSERCFDFNRSVLAYLADSPSIDVVVVSSMFGQYVDPTFLDRQWHVFSATSSGLSRLEPSVPLALDGMRDTIGRLQALGKRVVVIAPPPSADFDIGQCLDRNANGKLLLGKNRSCAVPLADYRRIHGRVIEFLDRVGFAADVQVIRFEDVLCGERVCSTELDGTFIYRDRGHLSLDGSRLLARKMNWRGLLEGGSPSWSTPSAADPSASGK